MLFLAAIGLVLLLIDLLVSDPQSEPIPIRDRTPREPWALVDAEPTRVVLPTFANDWLADAWRSSPPEASSQTLRRVAAQTRALRARDAALREAANAQRIASLAIFGAILVILLVFLHIHRLSGRFSAQTFLSHLRTLDRSNRQWLAGAYRDRVETMVTVVDAWTSSVVASAGHLADAARCLDASLQRLPLTPGPASVVRVPRGNRFLDTSEAPALPRYSEQRRQVREALGTMRNLTDPMRAAGQFERDANCEGAEQVALALQTEFELAYVATTRKGRRPEWVRATLDLARAVLRNHSLGGGASK